MGVKRLIAHLKPHDRNIGLSLGLSTIISSWGHRSLNDWLLLKFSVDCLTCRSSREGFRDNKSVSSPFDPQSHEHQSFVSISAVSRKRNKRPFFGRSAYFNVKRLIAHLKPHDRNIGLSLGLSTIISSWGHRSLNDWLLLKFSVDCLTCRSSREGFRDNKSVSSPFDPQSHEHQSFVSISAVSRKRNKRPFFGRSAYFNVEKSQTIVRCNKYYQSDFRN